MIRRLAQSYGIVPTYSDGFSRQREVSSEVLLAVLRLLGAPVRSWQDVPEALRQHRLSLWNKAMEPVVVAWEGRPAALSLRIPVKQVQGLISVRLTLEEGHPWRFKFNLEKLPSLRISQVEGVSYVIKELRLPGRLPWGYHRLTLEWGQRQFTSWIFSAPLAAHPSKRKSTQSWGLFVPPYALHTQRSWGGGDFSDLKRFLRWTASQGARVAGFLPFLATFLERPFDPSPYAPASRLFWNEFFIDISRVPELKISASARKRLDSASLQSQIERWRSSPRVDYQRVMAMKRQVLETLARALWTRSSPRRTQFHRFIKAHPLLNDYAQFRAATERQGTPWPQWPRRMKEGSLGSGDYNDSARGYHLYVQWIAAQQVESMSKSAQRAGVNLYLDFPLGVHPYSYDVWRERPSFAVGASVGAPPDRLFHQGQRWGFPPLHPQGIRADGYRYFIAALRHSMKEAGVLRLDHVMGFHRLFWIPEGALAKDGVYVQYRPEEFYAILSIESMRHKTALVGEDLGTVPNAVRIAMDRHRIKRTYVLQLEARGHRTCTLPTPPARSLVCLNTHDTPPFAAFLQRETALRRGLVRFLKTDESNLLKACLAYLMKSPASIVVVSLEDLWGEKRPQNIPGVSRPRTHWCRKARYPFELFSKMPQVLQLLRELNNAGCRRKS